MAKNNFNFRGSPNAFNAGTNKFNLLGDSTETKYLNEQVKQKKPVLNNKKQNGKIKLPVVL